MQAAFRKKVEGLRKEAVHVVPGSSGGWLGGAPSVSEGFSWPETAGVPMSFMGQIRLSTLPRVDASLSLPAEGYLLFFFDTADIQEGRVIWEPRESGLTEVAAPVVAPEPAKGLRKLFGRRKKAKTEIYRRLEVGFKVVPTYPPEESELLGSFDEDNDDEFSEFRTEVYGDLPAHHFFGYPDPEQGCEMELDCEIGSRKKSREDYENPAVVAASKDWRLLFQIDEDGATGFEFVDVGKVYFWIRATDAARGDFSRVHTICQFG